MAYTVTPAQQAQYETHGFFIARSLLGPERVQYLRKQITDTMAQGKSGINFDTTRMDGKTIRGSGMYRKLALLGRRNPNVWNAYYGHENVIDINRHFLGDEVYLWFDSIFTKPAKVGEATPWHQDIGLWTQNPVTKPKQPFFQNALTIWMAIDKADQMNGCLQVAPGSHKGEIVEHIRYEDSIHVELPRDMVKDLPVEHVELEAGDAIVWHAHLWHYSPVNRSDRNRLGIAQVSLAAADALGAGKTDLPPLLHGGVGQEAPVAEAQRSAPGA